MAKSLFSQVHTDMRIAKSSKGIVNIPGEVDKDKPILVSFHDDDASNIAVGILDGDQIVSVEDSTVGLRGKVGIKVRLGDLDGDGIIGIAESLSNSVLPGFNYPSSPLINLFNAGNN